MSKFPYENLSDEDFESLTIKVCRELFGVGCKTFSPGRDGGKDSWFEGTADQFPSKSAPWSGVTNIQAKHTSELNASCSDNNFLSNQTSVLNSEIARLKEVIKKEPFDNYLIFTNRKLTGGTGPQIIAKLKVELGVTKADIIGREQLDDYLNDYPHIANAFGLHQFISPIRFYEKELRDVIIVFASESKLISQAAVDYLTSFDQITKEQKNQLNYLGAGYFNFILTHSAKYFEEINKFLRDPKNEQYTRMYSNTVSDLQAKIVLERDRFSEFERLIEHLVSFIVVSNEDKLQDLRSIVRVFIHFMYFNCDIGKIR